MANSLIEMKGITKKFNEETVLDNVDFSIGYGEIHALIGENGAGKSVLMKILSGGIAADSGEIFVEGRKVETWDSKTALKNGIATIYQDINLIDELSVADNIFFNKYLYRFKFLRLIDWRRMYSESGKILEKLNLHINPKTLVKNLSIGQKQLVEIAKVISQNAKLLIMDEPCTGMNEFELENFHKDIRELVKAGTSVIYISHRLDDVINLCDRITVLRKGKVVECNRSGDIDRNKLIRYMVPEKFRDRYPKLASQAGRIILKADSITTDRGLKNVSFALRKGEILGVAGVLGSGRTALTRAIFGVDKLISGRIYINGAEIRLKSPKDAVKNRIAYIPDTVPKSNLIKDFAIPGNISLANLREISIGSMIKLRKEYKLAGNFVKKLVIKASRVNQNVQELSFGNQRKVVLSKWIFNDSVILILDEPTKGIDKGSKIEFYNFMNEYVLEGCSIIMASSDYQELIGMCDRILVMYNGAIIKVLERNDFLEEKILYYASGGSD